MKTNRIKTANDDDTVAVENTVGPSFELLQGDTMFIPYGEYPHKMGLQRFDRAAAQRMSDALAGIGGKVKRLITTGTKRLPGYIGHPDVPGRGAEFPDKKSYFWTQSIAVENEGARLDVKWTDEGRKLIEGGHFSGYSPYWESEQNGRVLTPVELISVGLTNNPNIPVPPLANDNDKDESESREQPNPEDQMKNELAELLGKKETDSEEDLLAEVKRILEVAATKENPEEEKPDDEAKAEEAEAEAEAEEEEAEKKAAENDALALTLRANRVDTALDQLCLSGKLAPADREEKKTTLLACANDADFAAELDKLSAAPPALKTRSVTDGLADDANRAKLANDAAVRSEKRTELIDGEKKRNGGSYEKAFAKMSRLHPEFF